MVVPGALATGKTSTIQPLVAASDLIVGADCLNILFQPPTRPRGTHNKTCPEIVTLEHPCWRSKEYEFDFWFGSGVYMMWTGRYSASLFPALWIVEPNECSLPCFQCLHQLRATARPSHGMWLHVVDLRFKTQIRVYTKVSLLLTNGTSGVPTQSPHSEWIPGPTKVKVKKFKTKTKLSQSPCLMNAWSSINSGWITCWIFRKLRPSMVDWCSSICWWVSSALMSHTSLLDLANTRVTSIVVSRVENTSWSIVVGNAS